MKGRTYKVWPADKDERNFILVDAYTPDEAAEDVAAKAPGEKKQQFCVRAPNGTLTQWIVIREMEPTFHSEEINQ